MCARRIAAPRRRLRQSAVIVLALAAVGAGGWWLQELTGPSAPGLPEPAQPRPWIEPPRLTNRDLRGLSRASRVPAEASTRLRKQFDAAVMELAHGKASVAAEQFRSIIAIAPGLVEAWVNLGYAELQSERCDDALPAFARALALRPAQANAYYGMAVCHEVQGDLARARGAMRSFVHLAAQDDPFLPRARAALWQWQQPGHSGDSPGAPADQKR